MLSLLLFSSPLLLFVLQFFPFGSTTRRLDCSYESLQSRRQINKKPHQENWSDELMEKRLSGENTALQPLKIRPKLFVPLADQIWILLDKCGPFPPLIFPFFFQGKECNELWKCGAMLWLLQEVMWAAGPDRCFQCRRPTIAALLALAGTDSTYAGPLTLWKAFWSQNFVALCRFQPNNHQKLLRKSFSRTEFNTSLSRDGSRDVLAEVRVQTSYADRGQSLSETTLDHPSQVSKICCLLKLRIRLFQYFLRSIPWFVLCRRQCFFS